MGHETLTHYFMNHFNMKQHHNWDLGYLESLMPWERYAYIDLLEEYLIEVEKENKQKEKEAKDRQNIIDRRLRENRPRK